MQFVLDKKYKPKGDQPKAIEELVSGLEQGSQFQTLLRRIRLWLRS
ncbi:MAG: UvrABC system protein B [Parcubacteria group bacterium GW2011_GWC1_45_14]|nr:MAG: UvrABC system protein B [Parcubacteria group bacterium GW2011_GWC1_45_14]